MLFEHSVFVVKLEWALGAMVVTANRALAYPFPIRC